MTVITKLAALLIGLLLISTGLALAVNEFANLHFLEGFFTPRENEENRVALFGLLVFGVGLSLLLTQFFAERYSAIIAGIAFVGTLAALLIFMLIARLTIFDLPLVDTSRHLELKPRDLVLSITCPAHERIRADQNRGNRTNLVLISGGDNSQNDQIREGFERRQLDTLVTADERIAYFSHVYSDLENPILVRSQQRARDVRFVLPELIRPRVETEIIVVSATFNDVVVGAQSLATIDEPIAETLVRVELEREEPSSDRAGRILARVDFQAFESVCGV